METDSIARFWDKYIYKTISYNVPRKFMRWYVKRAEDYIKAHPSVQLAQHSPKHVESYLRDLGRNQRLSDWQFKQAVEALRILFVEMVKPAWAESFQWDFWLDSATQLPNSHATIARDLPFSKSCGINANYFAFSFALNNKQTSRGKALGFHCVDNGFIKHTPTADEAQSKVAGQQSGTGYYV